MSDHPPRRPSLPAFAGLLALLLAYLGSLPLAAHKDRDFLHLWTGGHLVAEGRADALYSPLAQRATLTEAVGQPLVDRIWTERNGQVGLFFYPPVTAMAYATLGWLPARTAAGAEGVVALAGALAAAWALAQLRPARLTPWATAALVLLSPSFFFSFVLGQNGIFALLVVALAGRALLEGRAWRGGLILGLLAAKPSWLLALCWAPAVLGGVPAWLGLGLGAAAVTGLGVALLGTGPLRDYLALVPELMRLHRLPDYPLDLQFNLWSVPRRLEGLSNAADLLGALGAAAVVAVAVVRGRRLVAAGRAPHAWGLAMAAAALVNPHLHHYDVLPPLVGAAVILAELPDLAGRARRVAGGVLLGSTTAMACAGLPALGGALPLPTLGVGLLFGWLAWPVDPAMDAP